MPGLGEPAPHPAPIHFLKQCRIFAGSMTKFRQFIKDWMLPIAMAAGVSAYLIYHNIPALAPAGPHLEKAVGALQPMLIVAMLFLSFCKIAPRQMKPHRWQWRLLLIQMAAFVIPGLVLIYTGEGHYAVLVESFMICMICPTATAAAVITGKLGGDMPGIMTYTILINIVAALVVPTIVPLVHPTGGIGFAAAFSMIIAKTFPLLIMPCLCAWLVRFLLPKLHRRLLRYTDLSFYLWAVALALAIAVTTRAIVKSDIPVGYLVGIGAVSLLCCALQFYLGRKIGGHCGDKVTAGQALGQKNTVFAIWMAYTFMDPVTSIAGGFYSIWHNVFNSWQLYRQSHTRRNHK